jgi:3,4-dihydroxy 2-butanone 4-phosphate synthase/GTP cyclohydrolase II
MLGAEGKLNTHGGRADLLQNSMRIIEEEGRGVIVLIRDTTATVVSDMLLHKGDDDGQSMPRRLREYGVGAQILLDLGIHNMVLLSDTTRQVVGLDGYDLHIVGQEPISDNPRLQKSSKNKAEATS